MEKRHQDPSSPSSTGTDEVQFNKRAGGDDHLVPEELKHKTVCVIGLGYVGLTALSRSFLEAFEDDRLRHR